MRSCLLASFGSLLALPLQLAFILLVPGAALAKGGTDLHEPLPIAQAAIFPTPVLHLPTGGFTGCGRGRYRDPHNGKCRGPADVGH